jgi:hypothetical protein
VGQAAAQRFLDDHFDDLGIKSTIDLTAEPTPPLPDSSGGADTGDRAVLS